MQYALSLSTSIRHKLSLQLKWSKNCISYSFCDCDWMQPKWNSNKKNWKGIERFFLLILKDYYITIVVFLLLQYFILLLAVCQNNEKLKSRKIDWNCRILFVSFVRKMCKNGWSGNCPNRSWGSWFCLFRREREMRERTDEREKRTERKLRDKSKISENILKIADFWSALLL